jgi:hypothetical protein
MTNNELINDDLTEIEIENQQSLNSDRFKLLNPLLKWSNDGRPTSNLVDLMHWVKSNFRKYLNNYIPSNEESINCYIHNKIVIDGSFMYFCETSDVKISCLYKDSVASWNSEHDYEHFMAQGIFKITCKDFEFLHCALFHKGNQNEDEVSFFVIVEDAVFEKYVEFRNKFDKWLTTRDRNHLEVHVVGGEGYPYTRDLKWDDIFLPDNLKNEIKSSVEGFLNAKKIYEEAKVPWKRGILLYGLPGCGKSSIIKTIIGNYNFKPVTVQSGTQTTDDTITEAFEYAQLQEPGLLYIEDLDTLLDRTVSLSHFLNMLDGVSSKKGILVIATANDLSALKESIVDRPSRFDRKWEIPLPDEDMAHKYLQKWFGNSLKLKDYKKIASQAVENNFSYAYLKELYLSSVFNALAENREVPEVKDIMLATKQMLRDKENVKHGFETSMRNEMGIV